MKLTFEHSLFLSIAHADGWCVWLLLVDSDGRLDLSELALVNHLLLLAPLAIEQLRRDQTLVLHI